MDKKALNLVLLLIFLLAAAGFSLGFPPIACEFYGRVVINNTAVDTGLNVTAYDPNGVLCGMFVIKNKGAYGLLSCRGDDPSTPEDEGAEPGDPIRFKVHNYTRINATGNVIWQPGAFRFVNLSYNKYYCGDGICTPPENCENCPLDCGECPPPEHAGGGGGVGAAGGAAGGEGGARAEASAGTGAFGVPYKPPCKEHWVCSNWTNCSIEGIQTRICIDINNCGTNKSKPKVVQNCTYLGNCHDGIQNNGEEGIDCGGPCPPCPSCHDGIQNQGEEGIDCGGPCPPCIEKPVELEKPARVFGARCGNRVCESGEECSCLKDCRRFPWQLVLLVIVELLLLYSLTWLYKKLKSKREKDRLKIAKLCLWLQRFNVWLSLLAMLFVLSFSLYYYFVGSCWPLFIKYIYVVVIEALLVPLIGFYILKLFEYSEKKRLKALEQAIKLYNNQLKILLSIQRKELPRLEEEWLELANSVKKTPIGYKIFERFIELDKLLDFVRFLKESAYEDFQVSVTIANKVIASFDKLKKDEEFKAALESDEDLNQLFDKLEFIVEQYKERNELIYELDELSKKLELSRMRPSYLPEVKEDDKHKGTKEEQAARSDSKAEQAQQ